MATTSHCGGSEKLTSSAIYEETHVEVKRGEESDVDHGCCYARDALAKPKRDGGVEKENGAQDDQLKEND
ncbi:unnamed protein product [Heligmosomoides polygyrus]|uniref:Uncharacterized protein n=1 Tax=Heligmosomoides polygyrus TaxID=6339 RepID=A0A183FT49_HELPZ|nr:unnamed protein product [Heligmosomoides polygyrus]